MAGFAMWALVSAGALTAASVDDLTYGVVNGSITITGCHPAAAGELVIPPLIDGLPVTAIGDASIGWCPDLTAVILPQGVTAIGGYNFGTCPKLSRIHLPEGLLTIGPDCLDGSPRLQEITIPSSMKRIGNYAFSLSSLRKATILGADVIGQYAFAHCGTLEEVTFGPQVKAIQPFAFMNCKLSRITIPETVTYLGFRAFWLNPRLRQIVFPGDAPARLDDAPFGEGISPMCRIFHYPGAKGIESPTWLGVTTETIRPEMMEVELLPGKTIRDSYQSISFPSLRIGKAGAWKTLRIRNAGKMDLVLSAISKNGAHQNDFLLKPVPQTVIAPGTSLDVKLRFKPAGSGPRKAAIHLHNNTTAGGHSFDIRLTGTGLPLAD